MPQKLSQMYSSENENIMIRNYIKKEIKSMSQQT